MGYGARWLICYSGTAGLLIGLGYIVCEMRVSPRLTQDEWVNWAMGIYAVLKRINSSQIVSLRMFGFYAASHKPNKKFIKNFGLWS